MRFENYLLFVLFIIVFSSCSDKRIHGYFAQEYRYIVDGVGSSGETYKFKRNGKFTVYPGSAGFSASISPIGAYGKGKYEVKNDGYLYFDYKEVDEKLWKIKVEKTSIDTFVEGYNIFILPEDLGYKLSFYDDFLCKEWRALNRKYKEKPILKVPKKQKQFFVQMMGGGFNKDTKLIIKNDTSSNIKFHYAKYWSAYPGKTNRQLPFKKISRKEFELEGIRYHKTRNPQGFWARLRHWYYWNFDF